MRLACLFALLGLAGCQSDDCDCEPGEICNQGVCLQLCNGDADCPIALACVSGTCTATHDECQKHDTCRQAEICRTLEGAFCQGGQCHYPETTPGAACPLGGEDNGDLNQHPSETWTGVCSRKGECRACDTPDDDCELVFIVQPSDTVVGELISPAVEVQLRDKSGNTLDLGDVAIRIEVEPDSAALSGELSSALASGNARFSRLRGDAAGEYRLRASRSGVLATSDVFTVQPSCAAALDHYWPLTEDGTVFTDIASTYNATCVGSVCPGQNGADNALEFDGTDDALDVGANDMAPFNWGATDSFSVEFWMKAHADSCVNENEVVVGRDGGAQSGMHWWLGCRASASSDGKRQTAAFLLRDNDDIAHEEVVYLGGEIVVDQQWHHFVGVRDAGRGRVRLHVDGELVAVRDDILGALDSPLDSEVNFGWMDLSNGYYYRGHLSSVALYNRPLLDAEIRFHHGLGRAANFCDYTLPACGNGFVEAGEECDDANLDNGDGCSAWCTRELARCPAGMTAYWQLEGSGAHRFDDARSGLHATCSRGWGYANEAKICPTPTSDNGQLFDGGSMGLTARDATPFDWPVDQSFTIEFWMKGIFGQTCMPGAGNEVIVGRDDPGDPQNSEINSDLHWWVGCEDANGFAHFSLGDNSDPEHGFSVTGATINDGNWHHVVALHDAEAGEITIYVDGVRGEVESTSFASGFDSVTNVGLNIGWLNLRDGYHYRGNLHSMAIYSRSLSANEITSHHAAGRQASYCTGP